MISTIKTLALRVPSSIVAAGEQIIVSAISFGATVAFGAFATTEAFATFALANAIYMIAFGYHRSTVVIPFIYRIGRVTQGSTSTWGVLALLFAATAVLFLVVCGQTARFVGFSPLWSGGFLTGAILCAGLLPMDFARRRLMDEGAYWTLVGRSAASLALTGAGFIFLLKQSLLTAPVGAGLVSMAAALVYQPWRIGWRDFSLKRVREEAPKIWHEAKSTVAFTALAGTVFAIYNQLLPAIVAYAGGAAAIATFSAARIVSQPGWVLVNGLDNRERAEAMRAHVGIGDVGLRHRARIYVAVSLCLTALAAVAIVALLGFPQAKAFFARNHATSEYIALWLASSFVVAIAFPLESIAHVASKHVLFLAVRCVAAAVAILLMVALPIDDIALRGGIAYIAGWLLVLLAHIRFIR